MSTKILLVEDNDLDVIVVERMMKRLGVGVTIVRARNGEEALEILRSSDDNVRLIPPFIMFVDINMPLMNGFELLDELVEDEIMHQVPVYLMSTSDSSWDLNKAEQYTICDYVVKPLTSDVMRGILEYSSGFERQASS